MNEQPIFTPAMRALMTETEAETVRELEARVERGDIGAPVILEALCECVKDRLAGKVSGEN